MRLILFSMTAILLSTLACQSTADAKAPVKADDMKRMVGFHIDMNMAQYRADYLKRWLTDLADSGYNTIIWELEDGVEWETVPEARQPDALTKDEFRDVLELHSAYENRDVAIHAPIQFRTPDLPHDWRSLLRLRQGIARPRVALMLAAFEPRKRHLEFLRAFARTAHTLPDLKLLLAGTGPEQARVRAAVQDLHLQDHVIFCGHRSDPEALLALADVSVLTSEREGLPRVVVQSLAAGCPVVVTDMPGIDEVVQDGVNGHVVARDNLDGAVAQMRSMLTSDQTLKRLGAGALGTDVAAWSLARMGASVTALYDLPAMARAA